MVLVFILVVAIAGMTFNYSVFAQQSEVEQRFQEIGETVAGLGTKLDAHMNQYSVDTLVSRIYDQEQEIFGLERLQASGEATNRDLDRLSMIISQKAQDERRLDQLLSQ